MQFEIVDGWLFYTGPAACALAEEAGHVVDWTSAEVATDDAGEPFVSDTGEKLYRARLQDGPPAAPTYPRPYLSAEAPLVPNPLDQLPRQLSQLGHELESEKHARLLERQQYEAAAQRFELLGKTIQDAFRIHVGEFQFDGRQLPTPDPSKALELLGLELASRQSEIATLRSELDATKRELLELERAKQADEAAAEVP